MKKIVPSHVLALCLCAMLLLSGCGQGAVLSSQSAAPASQSEALPPFSAVLPTLSYTPRDEPDLLEPDGDVPPLDIISFYDIPSGTALTLGDPLEKFSKVYDDIEYDYASSFNGYIHRLQDVSFDATFTDSVCYRFMISFNRYDEDGTLSKAGVRTIGPLGIRASDSKADVLRRIDEYFGPGSADEAMFAEDACVFFLDSDGQPGRASEYRYQIGFNFRDDKLMSIDVIDRELEPEREY